MRLNKHIRFQLAAGMRRPATFGEVSYQNAWRKPGALPNTGFPGLTSEDLARIERESADDPPIKAGPRPRPRPNSSQDGGFSRPSPRS